MRRDAGERRHVEDRHVGEIAGQPGLQRIDPEEAADQIAAVRQAERQDDADAVIEIEEVGGVGDQRRGAAHQVGPGGDDHAAAPQRQAAGEQQPGDPDGRPVAPCEAQAGEHGDPRRRDQERVARRRGAAMTEADRGDVQDDEQQAGDRLDAPVPAALSAHPRLRRRLGSGSNHCRRRGTIKHRDAGKDLYVASIGLDFVTPGAFPAGR